MSISSAPAALLSSSAAGSLSAARFCPLTGTASALEKSKAGAGRGVAGAGEPEVVLLAGRPNSDDMKLGVVGVDGVAGAEAGAGVAVGVGEGDGAAAGAGAGVGLDEGALVGAAGFGVNVGATKGADGTGGVCLAAAGFDAAGKIADAGAGAGEGEGTGAAAAGGGANEAIGPSAAAAATGATRGCCSPSHKRSPYNEHKYEITAHYFSPHQFKTGRTVMHSCRTLASGSRKPALKNCNAYGSSGDAAAWGAPSDATSTRTTAARMPACALGNVSVSARCDSSSAIRAWSISASNNFLGFGMNRLHGHLPSLVVGGRSAPECNRIDSKAAWHSLGLVVQRNED